MLQLAVAFLLQQTVPPSNPLTLEGALRYARSKRGELAVASGRLDAARAMRGLARRPANPTVDVSMVAANDSRRFAVVQPLGSLARMRFDVGAASAFIDAERADSTQRAANLDRDVARAFFGSVAARTRVRVLGELTALADSLGTLAARRADVGDISELDRQQFALEGTRARLQLSRAREDERIREAVLVRVLAWSESTSPQPAADLNTPWVVGDRVGEGLGDSLATDIASVPAVRQARATALAANQTRNALQWARLPIPGLFFERDWSRTPGYLASTRIGLSIPIPVFSLGNEALGVAAGRARQADALATETQLEVTRAVATSRARVREAELRATLATDSLLTGVVRLREGALRLYAAGRTSILQVLEALRAERDAQLAAVDEQLALQEARADLAAHLGLSLIPTTRQDR